MPNIIPPDASQLFDTAVFNAQVPKEGPKALAVVCPFDDTHTSFQINMLLTTTQQFMSLIQSAFVDNSANSEILTINLSVLNWTVKIPPYSQAQVALPVPKNCIITVASEGAVNVDICFMNVPIATGIWDVGDSGREAISVIANTTQALGASGGAVGDLLEFITLIPASTSPGAVTIEDGASGAITIFAGGAGSVSNLVPFTVQVEALSVEGAWTITTGADISVLVNGEFT